MGAQDVTQWTTTTLHVDDYLLTWIEAFLVDRKSRNAAAGTLYFYSEKLEVFARYCDTQAITRIIQLTPDTLRRFILHLQESHNGGGVHAFYRALRAFLLWWEEEVEPEGWKNPIRKVKAPKVEQEAIEPVAIDTVQKLIDTCKGNAGTGLRDKALLLFLLDSGARAAEALALNVDDVDLITGAALIRQGKGRKPRTVFLEQKARRALRAYLRTRGTGALWQTDDGGRLTYWGLNSIITRRAAAAGVDKPELHDFRRAFAINFLRNGGDIFALQELMGHTSLAVLKRYLKLTQDDLRAAHIKASPVKNSGLRG
jgi:integrase/recombinase XerD